MQWGGAVHDFRANFSRVIDTSSWAATPGREQTALAALSNLLPAQLTIDENNGAYIELFNPNRITALSIAGIGQLVSGAAERTYQNQWEGAYTFTRQRGAHDLRVGADYVRLLPRTEFGNFLWTSSVASPSVGALLGEEPLGITVSYGKPTIDVGQIIIGSLFAQDTYKLSDRLSVLYGVRWEVTPPTNTPSGTGLFAVGSWNGPGTPFQPVEGFAALNQSSLPMHYNQIAPRLGLAYRFKKSDAIFRAGAGIFYDDAIGSLLYAVNLSPLNMWQYLPSSGNSGSLQFASYESPPALSLPKVWEWRTSIEKSLEGHTTVSLAYVGSAGRRLLRLDGTVDSTGILQNSAFTSYGRSDYDALQAQFTGKVTSNLYTLVSYSWAHSIDTGSLGSALFLVAPGFGNADDRGSSDFDVRHNLNASFSYRIPSWHSSGLLRGWFRDWDLSSTLQARTGFPFDVTSVDRSIGGGFANTGRPDLVPGRPIWINGNSVPGGRVLNPAAFIPVSGIANGTLGRNVLTGPGLFQIDASLRRQFRLFGRTSLEIRLSAFNLLNKSTFSNPEAYLGSPLFGQPTSMQSLMLGSGTPTNGITPIFESGGPRTAEFLLKFSF